MVTLQGAAESGAWGQLKVVTRRQERKERRLFVAARKTFTHKHTFFSHRIGQFLGPHPHGKHFSNWYGPGFTIISFNHTWAHQLYKHCFCWFQQNGMLSHWFKLETSLPGNVLIWTLCARGVQTKSTSAILWLTLVNSGMAWVQSEGNPFPTGNRGILTNERGDMKYITGVWAKKSTTSGDVGALLL